MRRRDRSRNVTKERVEQATDASRFKLYEMFAGRGSGSKLKWKRTRVSFVEISHLNFA